MIGTTVIHSTFAPTGRAVRCKGGQRPLAGPGRKRLATGRDGRPGAEAGR